MEGTRAPRGGRRLCRQSRRLDIESEHDVVACRSSDPALLGFQSGDSEIQPRRRLQVWRPPPIKVREASTQMASLLISKKSTFREGDGDPIADNDVIEESDVQEGKCLFEPLRNQFIRPARLSNARRVVVSNDHRSGIPLEGELDDFARMDARSIDRASEKLLEANQVVPFVEK
jgi:hypothetical protein